MEPPIGLSAGALGEPEVARYLAIVRAELTRSILPEVTSDRARGLVDMAGALLDHVIVRLGPIDAALAARDADRADALADLDAPGAGFEAAVVDAIHAAGDANRDAARRAVAGEERFLSGLGALEAGAVPVPEAPAGRGFSRDQIAAYLTRRYGGPVAIESIGSPLGGYSKDVFLLTLSGDARPADAIVMRRDLADGPLEGSVADEFAVLRAAHLAGVPVAEPLWVETDPAVFGGPMLCMAFARGKPIADIRAGIPAENARHCLLHLARIMAMVHGIDPVTVDAGEAARPMAAHVAALLDAFEDQWRRRRATDNAVIAAALAWMRANLVAIAADGDAPRIVHGDCSLRNLMFEDGAPTALLDWETWHFGDPAEDLAYVRDEVEAVMPWAEFVAAYVAAGGSAVSEARLRYWSMWRELRGAITSLSMLNSVSHDGADLRIAFGGIYFSRVLIEKLAARLKSML